MVYVNVKKLPLVVGSSYVGDASIGGQDDDWGGLAL